MTDQHTPGPWRWVPEPDTSWPWFKYEDLMSASGDIVATGRSDDLSSEIMVSHADARLIEAAPELLEALEGYISDCTNDECERCIKARAAIAKVRGAQ
jgi:hypothetical protein